MENAVTLFKKWSGWRQYLKLYRFVGARTSTFLGFGVLTGVLAFGTELAFAYLLQVFLVFMKIVPPASGNFPSWLVSISPFEFLGLVAVALLIRGFAQWLTSYTTAASYEIQRDHQRGRLVEWALGSRTISSGEVISLYTNGIEAVCNTLTHLQAISVHFSASFLILFFLARISPKTTIIAIGVLFGVGILSKKLNQLIGREGKVTIEKLDQINSKLLSNIRNLLFVQIYGTQDREKAEIRQRLGEVLGSVLRYQKLIYLKMLIPQTVGMIMIFGISIGAARRSWIDSAMIVTYFYLFVRFVQNFSDVTKLASSIGYSFPGVVRFAKWWAENGLDAPSVSVETEVEDKDWSEEHLGWRLQNVYFRYPGASEPLFSEFQLEVLPGSAVVIIGESGSGKSTLLSLFLGMNRADQGTVVLTVSGVPFSLPQHKKNLLKHVGYVGSESFLIAGTVRDNLLYGLVHRPSDAEIEVALRRAECDFVFQMNDGLSHKITEQGQGLSAGQKQRLSLARALLRKPKVLILDEATANLDSQTEKRIVGMLSGLKGSTTLVIVTHRDAPLEIADKVIRLNRESKV